MAKQNLQWTVNANGVDHLIEYKPGKLIVDGEKYNLKSSNWFIQLIDYAINFGDVTCRLVVVGSKVDLAVDGRFLGSGEAYEPIGNIPVVITIFSAVSVILGFLMNKWLGLAIGSLLAVLYFNLYLKKKNLMPVVIVFLIATVGQVVLGFLISWWLLSLM